MNKEKHRIDPRIVRTRQLLKDALIELLQEMEIDKITVNRIAERATINRVTFYLHYRDIPDMLDKMADDMIKDIQNALNNRQFNSGTEEEKKNLFAMVGLLEHIVEHKKFYKVVLGSKRTPIFTERLLKMLSQTVAYTVENKKETLLSEAVIQKDIAIWYGSSALIGTIVAWVRNDMPYTPQYLAQQFSLLNQLFKY
ncbi:TetR/AcrR family transcriptional regulator [Paenibacillus periandrae]|uniref:TetR/AcrR family transcriptional regulator n=1 Tax=Paenibacillus periandrae TaxID=1761741 RepID=UPI001F08F89A|nr:TetR/AcrR family transcriptional regulator [Paenibacillus periandrae]